MTIRGVLWDLDGVLVDTGEQHYRAWARTLETFQIPFSPPLFQETFGMNNWSILTRLLGHAPDQDLYTQVSDAKEKAFRQAIHGQVKPLPGVLETLQYLNAKGMRQAIASSAPPENIDALVDELGLRDLFQAVLSASKLPGKPAPDVFLASARAIGVPPHQCLVIEDAVSGVAGAKRAGMTCLAVINTNPAEALRQADYVVDSLLGLEAPFWETLVGKEEERN